MNRKEKSSSSEIKAERREKMINEVYNQDLFKVPQGYYLAHCISADFALGAGIAKQFVNVYNMREKLKEFYPIREGNKCNAENVGTALLVDNVFNLVTKKRAFNKPTYDSLYDSLVDMRDQCEERMITKLAIPQIGCGLDKLEWSKVKELIEDVFEDINIDILVCIL